MAIRIRKTGSVIASFATAQQVDISHTNDSVNIGDGTNLFGPLQNVGGTLCFPIKIMATALSAGDASASNQTSGAQKTQIVDDSGTNTVDATSMGAGVYALKVDVVSSVGGSAAPAFTDDAAATVGVTSCTPIGAMADEVAPDSVDEGDVGIVRMTLDRLLKIQIAGVASGISVPINDNAGLISIDDGAGTITVDATSAGFKADIEKMNGVAVSMGTGIMGTGVQRVAIASDNDPVTVKQATAANLNADVNNKSIGGVAISTGTGIMGTGVQRVAIASDNDPVSTKSTAANAKVDIGLINAVTPLMGSGIMGTGSLRVTVASDNDPVTVKQATAANLNASVDVKTINAVVPLMGAGNTGTGSLRVTVASDQVAIATTPAGNVAHDAVDSGNPVKVGGKAVNSNITRVASADRTDFVTDLSGRQVVVPHHVREMIVKQTTTISASTAETVIFTQVAAVFLDLVLLMITNTSATATRVDIRDTSAGTILFSVAIAANGGAVIPFPVAIPQTTVNTNWTAQCGTSVTDLRILAVCVKNI